MVRTGANVTFYLDKDLYDRFKMLCKTRGVHIAQAMNDLMRREVNGVEGQTLEAAPIDYAALKRDYEKLIDELDRIEKKLRSRKIYDQLENLASELGLEPDLSNMDQIIPRLLEEWSQDGDRIAEDCHLFISWLEVLKEKKHIEAQLLQFRKRA